MDIFMEIYQLRTFAAVAELGQLTRAGEALYVSQPAITAQIKALEEEARLANRPWHTPDSSRRKFVRARGIGFIGGTSAQESG
jgi:DNA-binding MarR family transcriptional regulator